MSWTAPKVTTRIEDRAYYLLEIFNLNMPLLYGERNKAFMRLEEEIIKYSEKHSIFTASWNTEINQSNASLIPINCSAR